MKLKYLVTSLVTLIFISINIIFSENDAAVDGFTVYGWPFNFYVQTEAKLTNPSYASQLGFFPKYLIADIFILIIFIIAGNMLASRVRKRPHK